jgi:hypothetical protein
MAVRGGRKVWAASLVAAYLLSVILWAYFVAARSDIYGGSPGRLWLVFGAFVLGLAIARWPVVLVPLLLPVVTAGAGNGTNPDSDIPIAGEMLLLVMPLSVAAAAAGVGVARLASRVTSSSRAVE